MDDVELERGGRKRRLTGLDATHGRAAAGGPWVQDRDRGGGGVRGGQSRGSLRTGGVARGKARDSVASAISDTPASCRSEPPFRKRDLGLGRVRQSLSRQDGTAQVSEYKASQSSLVLGYDDSESPACARSRSSADRQEFGQRLSEVIPWFRFARRVDRTRQSSGNLAAGLPFADVASGTRARQYR